MGGQVGPSPVDPSLVDPSAPLVDPVTSSAVIEPVLVSPVVSGVEALMVACSSAALEPLDIPSPSLVEPAPPFGSHAVQATRNSPNIDHTSLFNDTCLCIV